MHLFKELRTSQKPGMGTLGEGLWVCGLSGGLHCRPPLLGSYTALVKIALENHHCHI